MAVMCVLTVISPSAFAEGTADISAVSAEANGADAEVKDEPRQPQDEQYVARLCVCSRMIIIGHAWIYVENLTEHDITVGCYTCPPKQGVSVGAFGFQRFDGWGVYYNVEAYLCGKKNVKNVKCKSMLITKEQLDTVNEKILKTNEWSPFTNCCLFASKVWNSVADKHVAYGLFPFVTVISVSVKNEGNPNMYYPDESQCFRQKGKKDKATLKPCSHASLALGLI